jgi:RNA polymerase sigma-70 factor, ECF subfamily
MAPYCLRGSLLSQRLQPARYAVATRFPRPVTRIFVPPLEIPAACRVRLAVTNLQLCENFAEHRIRLFLPYILRSTALLGTTREEARHPPKRFFPEAAMSYGPVTCGADSTPLVPHCLRLNDMVMRRSVFWRVTCFCSRGVRNNMPEAALRTESDQGLEVVDHQSAARKLQDVMLLRLPFFYRCAFRVLKNEADAEDAVQEALLAAYKHINQFRGQSQISTWLTTIVRNCALMQLRRRPRQIHLPFDEQFGEEQPRSLWEGLADQRPSPEEEFRNSELTALLRKCTALLSPALRRTFQLRVVDGLSIFETARILGVPHGTVKAQLARARAKIARHVRPVLARSRRRSQPLHK